MRGTQNDAFTTLLDEPAPAPFSEFRAVLYSDHGDREPFLARKIGPFGDLPSLIDAVKGIAPRSWGDRDQGMSGSGFSPRQTFTQFPRVPSWIPRSRATSAIGLPVEITICTASALNCGLNLRRCSGMNRSSQSRVTVQDL
jgi:hypothetical protein